MPATSPTIAFDLREITIGSFRELSGRCLTELQSGARLLTLFGRRDVGERVVITAVLLSSDSLVFVLRASGSSNERYPSLTAGHPAAHMFEREIWEQTGVVPAGHPWLKPVRFEGVRQEKMGDDPFFVLRGKEVHEVAVGPIHAGVIEPGHFRFMCLGEIVHHLEIQLGYQHRGVETLLLSRGLFTLTPLVESIAGDSSVAYAWAHCAALEALTDTQLSLPVEAVRGVGLELERIAMHLVGLAGLCTDIAFLQGAATYGRLRTAVINAQMRVCGSRFGRGWLRPGGVVASITSELRNDLTRTLQAFLRDFVQVNELVLGARSVRARFQGTGVVSRLAAREVGLVGPAARASGVQLDTRTQLRGRCWQAFPVAAQVEQSGDCWARLHLRMTEIAESARWLCALLGNTELDLEAGKPTLRRQVRADALCVSVVEGFRGEVIHVLETDQHGHLLHYKVQDPSLQNWFGLALALRGTGISDFPICNKSFDLSYCGNDL